MSSLWLVRHAQASFGAADYDNLSELGITQSKLLGTAWAEAGVAFDAAYVGPQRRHRQTYEHVAAAHGDLPTAEQVDDLSEIDATGVGAEAMARVTPSCPDLGEQVAQKQLNEAGQVAMRHYARVFEELMKRWSRGELEEIVAPYADFSETVMRGLSSLMKNEGRGRRVVVFTSGGPVSIAARHALRVSPELGIELMFALRNASITELRYTEDRLTLMRFNDVGVLPRAMITGI